MTLGIIKWPLGLQNAKSVVFCIIFWMHKVGGWRDFGPHEGATAQSDLRVGSDFARTMSVWCVSGFDWQSKLGRYKVINNSKICIH